MFFITK